MVCKDVYCFDCLLFTYFFWNKQNKFKPGLVFWLVFKIKVEHDLSRASKTITTTVSGCCLVTREQRRYLYQIWCFTIILKNTGLGKMRVKYITNLIISEDKKSNKSHKDIFFNVKYVPLALAEFSARPLNKSR